GPRIYPSRSKTDSRWKTDENDALRKKLDAFRKKIEDNHHVKYWVGADDLKAKVIQSIAAETKRNPQEGWIRAGRSTDPARVEALRQEIDRLKAEASDARINAPQGTEIYASGEDECGLL